MTTATIPHSFRSVRPEPHEYPPAMAGYVAEAPDGDIVHTLSRQTAETLTLLRSIPESRGDHRYAPGKWSIREVIGHMTDAERVWSYRALRFSRADPHPIEGFDENEFVTNAPFSRIPLADLINEFEHVRRANIYLFNNMDEEALSRRGIANGFEISVRALAFTSAGHEAHHVEILRSRYL